MAKFTPRLTAPATNQNHWVHYTKGGPNYCIAINGKEVIPNCVGYAWGRWHELLGEFHQLSRGNAEDWFGRNDGYKRGTTPKLGAVICWRQGRTGVGSDGHGHVAIVEKINQNGSIVTSNSDYKGSRFYTRTMYPPFNFGNFVFQGFIYPPVNFDEPVKRPIAQIANDVLDGKYGNNPTRAARLKAEGYDPAVVQQEVNRILAERANVKPKLLPIHVIAKQIYDGVGNWSTGKTRANRLAAHGYDAAAVQAEVNKLVYGNKKSNATIAREIYNGQGGWGNNPGRATKLKAAGYDPAAVQREVNKLFK